MKGKDMARKPKTAAYAGNAENLYAYLLMRGDLPSLGRGKTNAHAFHAGNQLTHDLWVVPLLAGKSPDPRVAPWHAQGGGFGTAIALGSPGQITLDVIETVTAAATALGFPAGVVVDTSYPYIVDSEMFALVAEEHHTRAPKRIRDGWLCCRTETTAAWIMGDKDELRVLLARFDLAPND